MNTKQSYRPPGQQSMPKVLPQTPLQIAARARHASGRAMGLAAAVLAGGLIVSPPEFRDGVANLSSGAARATLAVSARILPFAKINANEVPAQIDIQRSHIENGYVEVNRAALDVSYNTPKGVTLWVGFDPRSVKRIEMQVGGIVASVVTPNTAIELPLPPQLNRRLMVNYRLYLSPTVTPGFISWPVSLAATASIE